MTEVKKTILNPAVVMEQTCEDHLYISVDSEAASVVVSMIGPKERIALFAEAHMKGASESLLDIYRFLTTGKV